MADKKISQLTNWTPWTSAQIPYVEWGANYSTTPSNLPISTATQAAIDLKADITYVDLQTYDAYINALTESKSYTDDWLALKVDKVAGKWLSTEDYTTTEKSKLFWIEDGAEVNEVNEAPIDWKQYARKDWDWSEVVWWTWAVNSVNWQTWVVVLDTDDIAQWTTNLYAPNWTQFTSLLDWPYTLNIVQQKLNRFNLNPATNWAFTTTWAIAWDTLTITNNSFTITVIWPWVNLSPREKWYFIYDWAAWREITRQELYLNWQNQWVKTTDTVTFANLSWTNTWDQDLSWLALKSNVLELDNTTPFTPDADYEPATKKYVDDNAGKVWTKEVDETDLANWKILVWNATSWKREAETPSSWWDATTNIWYLNIPQNSQSANYTLVLADSWKHIYHPSSDTTARTITIDSNANVAYPIWTAITFINDTSAWVMTIAITSDTLVLAWAWTTWSRTLAANWVATAIKVSSTRWIISWIWLT